MEHLKKLRIQKGLYQKDVASYLGIDRTTYVKYENGTSHPDYETLAKLSNLFQVTIDHILGNDVTGYKNASSKRVPVYGSVAAGIPIEAITDIEDWEEIPADWQGEYAALRIHGNSMEPRMYEGDVVIVRIQEDIQDGDVAIVLVNGDNATCKKVKKTPEGLLLVPFNQNVDPIFYSNADIQNLPVRIWGKVVELRQKY